MPKYSEDNLPNYVIHTNSEVCGFMGLFEFLSNFFPCTIHYEGLIYPSVEHAYQAAKWPNHKRGQFTMISASEAKKLGKKATIDKKVWEKKKYGVMRQLVFQKFLYNPDLKECLLATDDAYLEERNHWGDMDWGCNEAGQGENNLGRIIMGVQATIKNNKL